MKKKLLLVALMAGTMALSTTAFTACSGGNYSETYDGAVSESSYDSADKAAEGFVKVELSGSENRVELTEYKKEKVLTDSEVTALKISEQEVGGKIESVELGKVSYKQSVSKSALSAVLAGDAAEEGVHVVTLYIITYTKTGASVKSYKYYAPLPEEGEALSASYYNSVLDSKKYENCTAKMSVSASESATMAGKTESYTASAEYVMSLNANKAYVEYKASMPDENGKVTSVSMSMYLVDSPMGVKCAASISGESYVVVPLYTAGLHVSSVSELYSSQLTEAQCSLFVKTSYGFKLKEDALKNLFGEEGSPNAKFDGKCEYYVTEGRISKQVVSVSMEMTDAEYGSMSMKTSGECKYSGFGKTTVTIPDEVKTLLGVE